MARENIKMKSTESDEFYMTTKNKKKGGARLEKKMYDKKLRRHVAFREAK